MRKATRKLFSSLRTNLVRITDNDPVLQACTMRYVHIRPLSGLIRADAGERQLVSVLSMKPLDGPGPITEWVLLPLEYWDDDLEPTAVETGDGGNILLNPVSPFKTGIE